MERLQKNRAAFTAMGNSDPQTGVYSKKLNSLTPEIARLTAELRRQRVAHIQVQLQAQLVQLTDVQNRVRQQQPVTVGEWQQRSEGLVKYSALLDERQALLNKLQSEQESPSPEGVKLMSDGKAEIEAAKTALEKGHQQIELADATIQYAQLTKKRGQLLDAYTRAFGTAKERPTLQDLISVLGQMVTNRDRAAGLGDKAAPAQLIKCRIEAEKCKKG